MGPKTSGTSLSQNQDTRKQEERNPVSGARKMFILATSALPRRQHVISLANKDILNEPASKKRVRVRQRQEIQTLMCRKHRTWRSWRWQQWIWIWLWPESQDTWSLRSNSVSPERRLQSILWGHRQSWRWCHGILHVNFHNSKYRTLQKDLQPIRGMSRADLKNYGFVNINVTCNDIIAKARFYVINIILGLGFWKEFKLVIWHLYADSKAYLWSLTM